MRTCTGCAPRGSAAMTSAVSLAAHHTAQSNAALCSTSVTSGSTRNARSVATAPARTVWMWRSVEPSSWCCMQTSGGAMSPGLNFTVSLSAPMYLTAPTAKSCDCGYR